MKTTWLIVFMNNNDRWKGRFLSQGITVSDPLPQFIAIYSNENSTALKRLSSTRNMRSKLPDGLSTGS
jgi:hypothetical protein